MQKMIKIKKYLKDNLSFLGDISSILGFLYLIAKILIVIIPAFFAVLVILYLTAYDVAEVILNAPIWKIQIILKLWQVLLLILIAYMITIYILKRYNKFHSNVNNFIKEYNLKLNQNEFILYENFNWHIPKDIFDRYHIDRFPYCIKHNKQIVWTKDSIRIHRCPDCDNTYKSENIEKLYPELQEYIRKELNLFYLPELNYGIIDYDKIYKYIERHIGNIKNQ